MYFGPCILSDWNKKDSFGEEKLQNMTFGSKSMRKNHLKLPALHTLSDLVEFED
jgi:hypothetical protein